MAAGLSSGLSRYPWLAGTPNVWAYLRKSRNEEDDPEILSTHRGLLVRIARAEGLWLSPERIIEEIGSADEIESRPRFRALLSEWERLPPFAGGVLLSTEVSRLTRGLQSQQGRVQDVLRTRTILHRTASRWYDLSLPEDATAWELEGFVARLELRAFKWRMALGQAEALRRGRPRNGHVPWGYLWDKGAEAVRVDPVRFDRLCRCCREVFSTSVRTLSGRYGVSENALRLALRNPFICGWQARRFARRDPDRPDPKRRDYSLLPRERWDWAEEESDYPRACTREQWEAIQQVLEYRRTTKTKPGRGDGWCRDRVVFQGASSSAHLSVWSDRGRSLPTYEVREKGGPQLWVPRAAVHHVAYAALSLVFAHPGVLAEALAEVRRRNALREERAKPALSETLRRDLSRSRQRLDGVNSGLLDAQDPEERASLARVRDQELSRLSDLKAALSRLQSEESASPILLALEDDLPRIAGAFSAEWAVTPPAERQQLVNAVLARIPVRVHREKPYWPHERAVLPPVFAAWLVPYLGETAPFSWTHRPGYLWEDLPL